MRWASRIIPQRDLPDGVVEMRAAEVARLMPMGHTFDGFIEHRKQVSPTCLITFDHNRLSVAASFASHRLA